MSARNRCVRGVLVVASVLILSSVWSAEPLSPKLQRLVARGVIEVVEADDDRYTLKLGPRFHESSADRGDALIDYVASYISLAYPGSKSLEVLDGARKIRTVDLEYLRSARSSSP